MKTTVIMISRGAPNQTKEGLKKMCAIALSRELGLIRLYPLNAEAKQFRMWTILELEVERNSQDRREESYKILTPFKDQPHKIEVLGKLTKPVQKAQVMRHCMLPDVGEDPVVHLNNRHLSLALVKPEQASLCAGLHPNTKDKKPKQCEQFWLPTQADWQFIPKINWRSQEGKNHCQQIVGFEFQEFLRQNRNNPNQYFDNIHLYDKDYFKLLVIGNQINRRTSFVIVDILRFKLFGKVPKEPLPEVAPFLEYPAYNHLLEFAA